MSNLVECVRDKKRLEQEKREKDKEKKRKREKKRERERGGVEGSGKERESKRAIPSVSCCHLAACPQG